MILRDVLREGIATLKQAGIDGPERDARALAAMAVGIPAARLSLEPDLPVSSEDQNRFKSYLQRRIAREPVSKILGLRAFWGRDFRVTRDVLDPRPETETLIAAVLDGPAPHRVLDLGTGSGCIAVTLLAERPDIQAVASDISPTALDVAAENAARHGVADRLTLCRSDWFGAITGTFDLILSNPPYISAQEMTTLSREVSEHDPHLALSPGGDGLGPYHEIAAGAPAHLAPNGRVMVEIGWRQGPDVARIFQQAGFHDIRILPDLDGRNRVICASVA